MPMPTRSRGASGSWCEGGGGVVIGVVPSTGLGRSLRWVLRLRGRLRLRRLRLGWLRLGWLRSVGFGGGFFDEGEEGGEVVGAGVGVEQGGFEPEAAVEA